MYLVLVREAAGSVVMYAVVSLLLVWAVSGLVGWFRVGVGGVGRGCLASSSFAYSVCASNMCCIESVWLLWEGSGMSWFSSSGPQWCSGGEGAEVRGGLREWVVSISFGSGGAGPERPFLLVCVLGDTRAVWWFLGDGVLVIRSCDLLLV